MFFHKAYALHGAFWHGNYGVQMSHGCVNLAPLDAKWLFFFTNPAMPRGLPRRLVTPRKRRARASWFTSDAPVFARRQRCVVAESVTEGKERVVLRVARVQREIGHAARPRVREFSGDRNVAVEHVGDAFARTSG